MTTKKEAINKHGDTTLVKAAHEGKIDTVRVLIESGADVNVRTIYGYTALDATEHSEIVETLRENIRKVSESETQEKPN